MFTVTSHKHGGEVVVIDGYCDVDTYEEAKRIAATFPKWLQVKASFCNRPGGVVTGSVYFRASLKSDGVNGGKNEAGIKRIKAIFSRITYTVNSTFALNAATAEEIIKAIS